MVSLPLGAYAPKTTSAIALAPSVPGIHTSRTAFAFDTTSRRSRGRPLKRTTTTFSLTLETRSSSLCWISGIRIFALLVASPDCRRSSPIARTTTSASFAAFTASRSIVSSSSGVWDCSIASPKPSRRMSEPSIGEPAWKLMFVVSACAFTASSRFVTSFASPIKDQEPIRFLLWTYGPTQAIFFSLQSGRIFSSFFSSTKDFLAASLARSRCSLQRITSFSFVSSASLYAFSNSPSLFFSSRIRIQDSSIRSSESLPSLTRRHRFSQ